ncbi:hypothetical protein QJS66_05305 [Kocuria rhizophila]|nr:hypothetical protein QJS66_05305 [Kocuria rhizophila]
MDHGGHPAAVRRPGRGGPPRHPGSRRALATRAPRGGAARSARPAHHPPRGTDRPGRRTPTPGEAHDLVPLRTARSARPPVGGLPDPDHAEPAEATAELGDRGQAGPAPVGRPSRRPGAGRHQRPAGPGAVESAEAAVSAIQAKIDRDTQRLAREAPPRTSWASSTRSTRSRATAAEEAQLAAIDHAEEVAAEPRAQSCPLLRAATRGPARRWRSGTRSCAALKERHRRTGCAVRLAAATDAGLLRPLRRAADRARGRPDRRHPLGARDVRCVRHPLEPRGCRRAGGHAGVRDPQCPVLGHASCSDASAGPRPGPGGGVSGSLAPAASAGRGAAGRPHAR